MQHQLNGHGHVSFILELNFDSQSDRYVVRLDERVDTTLEPRQRIVVRDSVVSALAG